MLTCLGPSDLKRMDTRSFYATQLEGSSHSPSVAAPHILDLFAWARSVMKV